MTRHRSPQERRAQILQAARDCFAERGYAVTRVEEIAKAAGFAIFADELQQAQAEISEEELAGLIGAGNQHNGGGFTVNINNGIGSYASFLCF